MKLAVIGLGTRLGYLLNDVFRKAHPKLRVVGVIDKNQKTALTRLTPAERRSAKFCDSVQELLKKTKPDAVAIGTRCNLHTPYAVEVMAEGLPLFLEKPVAISLEQAQKLETAAETSTSKVVVSFPLRMSPLCRQARSKIESGTLGSAEHFLGVNYVPYGNVYFDSWYRDYETTNGLFLQKATHDFDYLSYLAGSPIVRVAAMLSQGRVYRDSSQRKNKNDKSALFYDKLGTPATGMNEDSSNVLFEFASGAQGLYTQVFYAKRDAAARGATISGHKATLSFDWYQSKIKIVRHNEPFTDVISADTSLNHFGGDDPLGQNFIDIVEDNAESLSSLQAGLQSVYACLAARSSAHEGRFVNVRQVGQVSAPRRFATETVRIA
jgi:predicted dehydrogenase